MRDASIRLAWVFAAVVLLAGLATAIGAEDRTEVEVVFQQGLRGYAGTTLKTKYGGEEKRQKFVIGEQTLTFADLELPGKNTRILSAKLQMRYVEEGWGRIRNARLELIDAAKPDAGPAVSLPYRKGQNPRIAGMDPKTRGVSWELPVDLVTRWVKNPATNKGLVLKAIPTEKGPFQIIFKGLCNNVPEYRPSLVVRYSFVGQVPPERPDLLTRFDGRTVGTRFPVSWQKKRFDLNEDAVTYELECAPDKGEWKKLGEAPAGKLSFTVDTRTLDTDRSYRVRVRGRDTGGLTGKWAEGKGTFRVSRTNYLTWPVHALHKVMRDEGPPAKTVPVHIRAARNEYESFQIVIRAQGELEGVDVSMSDLRGPGGAVIPRKNITLYRVHYVNCKEKGWLPDSMVPLVHPLTARKIGGEYGAPFGLTSGRNQPLWVEVYVPVDARPGEYEGQLTVTIKGEKPATVPVKLEVWNFTLPKTTTLKSSFGASGCSKDYIESLHAHRLNPWSVPVKDGPKLTEQNGKIKITWTEDYDRTLEAFFDGSYFKDGIGGNTFLLPRGCPREVSGILKGKDENRRIQVLQQFEEHFRNKPYVDKLAWFFIDEPSGKTLELCEKVARDIKKHSPSIKFLLTTRFNPKLVGLVDVWDTILNVEVIGPRAPGPEPYREEMRKGRDTINCITCCCNHEGCPNLFIHFSAMHTRVWPWVTYHLGHSGIEFWAVRPAKELTVPRHYGAAWGDGSLFYQGKPEFIGGPKEIPLPAIRLKILRDAMEDYEYLAMLAKQSKPDAERLCRKLVQDTKKYDGSFSHVVRLVNWEKKEGHVVWESDPARLYAVRAEIAAKLSRRQP